MVGSTAVTVGNFDGVHRGHAALIEAARQAVGETGRVVALTFDPNPIAVLRPGSEPPRLTTYEQRRRILAEAGADEVVRLEPTPDFLGLEPYEFMKQLVDRFRPGAIVEGPDFRFGKGRAGSVETLREHGDQLGFRTVVVDPLEAHLTDQTLVTISSSMVRWLIARGRVRDAGRLLGHGYELTGPVVTGDRRGRTIGMPTANLRHEQQLPADGIYAAQAVLPDGATRPAAVSIGTKPTFGEHPRLCEAHLIGYDGPLDEYDWPLRLIMIDWLRDQIRYDDTEALVAQLQRDVENTSAAVHAAENPASMVLTA